VAPKPAEAASVDRDALTEAWGDGILQSLPARAKARYASGRFVAVDDRGAHFALPNAAHRDQCAEHQGLVEAALATHFGSPVTLVLVVEGLPAPSGPQGASKTPRNPAGGGADARAQKPQGRRGADDGMAESDGDNVDDRDDMDEMVDPAEFDVAADETAAAEARLMQAFPGASEVLG
jgi:hypothetical protein